MSFLMSERQATGSVHSQAVLGRGGLAAHHLRSGQGALVRSSDTKVAVACGLFPLLTGCLGIRPAVPGIQGDCYRE